TLKMYLKRFKRINIKVLKSWCRQILKGLSFLHSRNPPVIHRDLKCDNIFITGTTGSVKIGDLGLATLKNKSYAKSVIGTPEFMAPEMYEEMYDESVDVYAFGMCLLEMVTGEYPYSECQFPAQIYRKVTTGVKPECFNRIPQQYPEIREIIDRCIRVRREERSTVKQLLADDFFMPEELIGIRVEIKNRDADLNDVNTEIQMQLRVFDEKKRKQYRFKENEGLQFAFDIESDKAEEVVQQMIEQQHIPDEDTRMITKLIKDKVEAFKRDREFRHAEIKRQREEEARKLEEEAIRTEMQLRAKEKERLEKEREAAAAAAAAALLEQQLHQQQQQLQIQQQQLQTAPQKLPTATVDGEDHADMQTGTHLDARHKKTKRKIVIEVLRVASDDTSQQPLVSCRLDTSHKTVTFQFAPDSDKPNVIAEKLLDQDCLTDPQVSIVVEQLERVIELIREDAVKAVGTKLVSFMDVQPAANGTTQIPPQIDGLPAPSSTASMLNTDVLNVQAAILNSITATSSHQNLHAGQPAAASKELSLDQAVPTSNTAINVQCPSATNANGTQVVPSVPNVTDSGDAIVPPLIPSTALTTAAAACAATTTNAPVKPSRFSVTKSTLPVDISASTTLPTPASMHQEHRKLSAITSLNGIPLAAAVPTVAVTSSFPVAATVYQATSSASSTVSSNSTNTTTSSVAGRFKVQPVASPSVPVSGKIPNNPAPVPAAVSAAVEMASAGSVPLEPQRQGASVSAVVQQNVQQQHSHVVQPTGAQQPGSTQPSVAPLTNIVNAATAGGAVAAVSATSVSAQVAPQSSTTAVPVAATPTVAPAPHIPVVVSGAPPLSSTSSGQVMASVQAGAVGPPVAGNLGAVPPLNVMPAAAVMPAQLTVGTAPVPLAGNAHAIPPAGMVPPASTVQAVPSVSAVTSVLNVPVVEPRSTLEQLENELRKVSGAQTTVIPTAQVIGTTVHQQEAAIPSSNSISAPGTLPLTSLPHTPSAYSDLSHNLAGLNDKLLALSQKLQGDQLDENQELSEEDLSARSTAIPPPRPSVTPATPALANAAPSAAAAPASATSTVSANTPAAAVPAAAQAASTAAGIMHVDTLNGLADALQKVIHLDVRESSVVPPPVPHAESVPPSASLVNGTQTPPSAVSSQTTAAVIQASSSMQDIASEEALCLTQQHVNVRTEGEVLLNGAQHSATTDGAASQLENASSSSISAGAFEDSTPVASCPQLPHISGSTSAENAAATSTAKPNSCTAESNAAPAVAPAGGLTAGAPLATFENLETALSSTLGTHGRCTTLPHIPSCNSAVPIATGGQRTVSAATVVPATGSMGLLQAVVVAGQTPLNVVAQQHQKQSLSNEIQSMSMKRRNLLNMDLGTTIPISPFRAAVFHVGTPPPQHSDSCSLSGGAFESLRDINEHPFSPATSYGSEFDLQMDEDFEYEDDDTIQALMNRHRMELEMLRERQRRELQLARQRIRQSRAHTANAFASTSGACVALENSANSSPRAVVPTHLPLMHHQYSRISNTTATAKNSSLSLPASPPANPHLFDTPSSGPSPKESLPRRAMVEGLPVGGRRPPSVDAVLSRPRPVIYYQIPLRQLDSNQAKQSNISDFDNALQNAIHSGASQSHNNVKLSAPVAATKRASPTRSPAPLKERKLRDRLSLPPQ
ncbi:Serine/threonine-protein kinase WNK1, partial [Toxocara canis]